MLKGYAVSLVFSGTSKEAVEESAKSVGSIQRAAVTSSKPIEKRIGVPLSFATK
jgi:hypothetical protein